VFKTVQPESITMRIEIDLTEAQVAELSPLFDRTNSMVLASIHKHRPFKPDMPAEKIGTPVIVCGTVPASVLPKLRKIIEKEKERIKASEASRRAL
jgi:hypothetical protein